MICWVSSNLPLFNNGIELIQRVGTCMPVKFKLTPFNFHAKCNHKHWTTIPLRTSICTLPLEIFVPPHTHTFLKFLVLIPKHLVRDYSHMSVPLPGTVYQTVSAILILRHHWDRLWNPISFNKVSKFLPLFLWRIFLSTNFLLRARVRACTRACVCVRARPWCVD